MIIELLTAAGVVSLRSLWKRWRERTCKWEHNGCAAEVNSPEHPDWKDDACIRCKKTQREYCPLAPAAMYTENYGDLYRSKAPFSSHDWALLKIMAVRDGIDVYGTVPPHVREWEAKHKEEGTVCVSSDPLGEFLTRYEEYLDGKRSFLDIGRR